MCVFEETCGIGLALEHNGDLYSCDHFCGAGLLLGNIMEKDIGELAASEKQYRFGQDKRDTLPQACRECNVLFVCQGECPKNRFLTTPGGEPGLNYLCKGWKAFFRHIDFPMQILAGLIQEELSGNGGDEGPGSGRGFCKGRPKRPLSLRQRAQVQTLPRPARKKDRKREEQKQSKA